MYYPLLLGVGKTTLQNTTKHSSFKLSVSHTTRLPRSNEVRRMDYHFVSENEFKDLIKQDAFYEYAKIFGNFMGHIKQDK